MAGLGPASCYTYKGHLFSGPVLSCEGVLTIRSLILINARLTSKITRGATYDDFSGQFFRIF